MDESLWAVVGAEPEPKELSDAITRGFGRALDSDPDRLVHLGETLMKLSKSPVGDAWHIRGGKKKRRIEVSWVEPRVTTAPGEFDPRPVKSSIRGYLIRETKKVLVITSSIIDERAHGQVVAIPKRSITKRVDG